MTKAEEAALKAYPNVEQPVWDESYPKTLFVRHSECNAFIKGYEQAEKDTIERAVTWLKNNANKYIVDLTETYPDAPANIIVGGMCWENLTKYLKDNDQH